MPYKIISLTLTDLQAIVDTLARSVKDRYFQHGYMLEIDINSQLFEDQADRMGDGRATANEIFTGVKGQYNSLYGKFDDGAFCVGRFDHDQSDRPAWHFSNTAKFELARADYFMEEIYNYLGNKLASLFLRPDSDSECSEEDRHKLTKAQLDTQIEMFYKCYFTADDEAREAFMADLNSSPINPLIEGLANELILNKFELGLDLHQLLLETTASQDAVKQGSNQHGDLVVVADGLGSYGPDSRFVSAALCNGMLATMPDSSITDQESFFTFIKAGLLKSLEYVWQMTDSIDQRVASTLLVLWFDRGSNRVWVFQKGDGTAEFTPDDPKSKHGGYAFKTQHTYGCPDSLLDWQTPTDCISVDNLMGLKDAEGVDDSASFLLFLNTVMPFKGPAFQSYPFQVTPTDDEPAAKGQVLAGSDGIFDNIVGRKLSTDVQHASKLIVCYLNKIHYLLDPRLDRQEGPLARIKILKEETVEAQHDLDEKMARAVSQNYAGDSLQKQAAATVRRRSLDRLITEQIQKEKEIADKLEASKFYTYLKTIIAQMKVDSNDPGPVLDALAGILGILDDYVGDATEGLLFATRFQLRSIETRLKSLKS